MGVTRLLGDRVQIVLGDCIAEGPPEVAAATLAHEARHTTAVHAAIWNLLAMRARLIFLAGWALAWPAALWAALAVHAGLAALKWYMEVSADLAAARATGPDVMTKVFDVMTDLAAARRRAQRRGPGADRDAGTVLGGRARPPADPGAPGRDHGPVPAPAADEQQARGGPRARARRGPPVITHHASAGQVRIVTENCIPVSRRPQRPPTASSPGGQHD